MAFAVKKPGKADGYPNVVKGVDLSVQSGEIHAPFAANAARKSTLIYFLPDAIAPRARSECRNKLGDHTFQGSQPEWHLLSED